MAGAKCSKCGVGLVLGSVLPGPTGVMPGGDLLEVATRALRQPRACSRCKQNFCTACAMKAGEGKGGGEAYHSCPKCGMRLGRSDSRSSYIKTGFDLVACLWVLGFLAAVAVVCFLLYHTWRVVTHPLDN
jgi:hypothetical protein